MKGDKGTKFKMRALRVGGYSASYSEAWERIWKRRPVTVRRPATAIDAIEREPVGPQAKR
jgi:hypothetical protein